MRVVPFSLLGFLFSLLACTSTTRAPSSTLFDNDRVNRIQEIDKELSRYWNNDWKTDQKEFQTNTNKNEVLPVYDRSLLKDTAIRENIERLTAERALLTKEIANKLSLQGWDGTGPLLETIAQQRQTTKLESFQIKDANQFTLENPAKNPFPLEHRFFSSYKLRLENLLQPPNKNSPDEQESKKQYFLKARMECDADMVYDGKLLFINRLTHSSVYEFNWYYNNVNAQNISIEFSPRVTRCQLKYYDPLVSNTWTHVVDFADLFSLSNEWYKLSQQVDICALPNGKFKDSVTSFFWQQDYNFNSCPQSYDEMIHLDDPYNSINQRIIALTGSPLKRKDFDDKNPMAVLDFSKAPQFDVIWVSSLNYSADFYGMVLSRAIRYHAERGTQIRILTAEPTMKKKDKALLEILQAGAPNVKLQYYKYRLSEGKDGTWFDRFHRVSHTKLLIGYSAKTPKASFLVTGGRNIRDSYLFKEAPIYRAYAFLKNYGDGEEPFIFYQDFEVEVRGHAFVKSVLSQMISFWMRDGQDHSFRSANINVTKDAAPVEIQKIENVTKQKPLVRHLLSLPYFDGYQLEKFYIQMIDSARSEISITTPYLRPSVAISEAFDRAAARGVKIQIMTRIHLAGDGVPQIAEDVNKQGINRLLRNVDIYEWTDEKSILHAKLFVVDKKLAFVSSVNLNRRSFLHDVESGVLVLHDKTALALRAHVINFIKQGRRITQEEKISWINGTLIDWADSYF